MKSLRRVRACSAFCTLLLLDACVRYVSLAVGQRLQLTYRQLQAI